MEKIIKDGKVAVAVSYGHGAGWSTWEDISPLDGKFNQLFIDGNFEDAKKLADELGLYVGGIRGIKIEWIDIGTYFRIDEYDGAESLVIFGDNDYLKA